MLCVTTTVLNLESDVVDLTAALCDVGSVSGQEKQLADAVFDALAGLAHLTVFRDGDTVVAATNGGKATRVAIAGHLDTVPVGKKPDGSPNFPTWRVGEGDAEMLHGRGTVDMLGGVANQLACAATIVDPVMDVNWIFYDHEEVEETKNGLKRLAAAHPEVMDVEFAVLGEPTNGLVEGGCNGTMRAVVHFSGVAAHSARAWMGTNAIHAAGELLTKLAEYDAGAVEVDGLTYRQSLSAVKINGGVAGNVVPDACDMMINYRFAPDKTPAQAEAFLREFCAGYELTVVDAAPGARPGLQHPAAASFVALTGTEPQAKVGWTDVSRFAAHGVPAINFGPGDPLLAHKDDERVAARQIRECFTVLRDWLSGQASQA